MCIVFHEFWVALSLPRGGRICNPYTPVQSKHTFQFLYFSLKRFPEEPQMSQLLSHCWSQMWFLCEKRRSKNCFKKSVPPDSNYGLFPDPEAPGEAASRARCSDKKQLFEQQLKHCSRFWPKKVKWAQNRCRKLTELLNRLKKLNGSLKIVDCWKLKLDWGCISY